MYDGALEIFQFLPIYKTNPLEEEYISHLRNALFALANTPDSGAAYGMMPFHLLFMMVIQYWILRIYKLHPRMYANACIFPPCRQHEQIKKPESVFTLAYIGEAKMMNLFEIVNVPREIIARAKSLINDRNDRLAHAKGGIESDPESKIQEYLDTLKLIHSYIVPLNDRVVKRWKKIKEKSQTIKRLRIASYG